MFRCYWLLLVLLTGCAQTPDSSLTAKSPLTTQAPHKNEATVSQTLLSQHQQWQGVPHRWGGEDRRGLDCSALVQLTYAQHFALALPRTTAGQALVGQAIPRQQVQAGDLVFFKTGPSQRHVGMMVDQQRFLHVSSSKGVILSQLDNPYWRRHYWQMRRVL